MLRTLYVINIYAKGFLSEFIIIINLWRRRRRRLQRHAWFVYVIATFFQVNRTSRAAPTPDESQPKFINIYWKEKLLKRNFLVRVLRCSYINFICYIIANIVAKLIVYCARCFNIQMPLKNFIHIKHMQKGHRLAPFYYMVYTTGI